MKETLPVLVPIITVMLGAILTFLFARRSARLQERLKLTTEAYLDFWKAVVEIAMAQKNADRDREKEGSCLLANAKGRICMYGTPEVVHELAEFWRHGGRIENPDAIARFVRVFYAMRRCAKNGRSAPAFQDLSQLLFSMDLKNDPLSAKAAVGDCADGAPHGP